LNQARVIKSSEKQLNHRGHLDTVDRLEHSSEIIAVNRKVTNVAVSMQVEQKEDSQESILSD